MKPMLLLCAMFSMTACATDTDSLEGDRGLRPEMHDHPDINESFDIGAAESTNPLIDDGRLIWAEDVMLDGARLTKMHRADLATGIDEITLFDEDGVYIGVITSRYRPTKLDISDPK